MQLNVGQTLERKDLLLAKRRMLAEFELNNSSTIIVNKKEVSKNDVLLMFETLEDTEDLHFHSIVFKDEHLLFFLEHNDLLDKKPNLSQLLPSHSFNPILTNSIQPKFTPVESKFSISNDDLTEDFLYWISPYFAYSFKVASFNFFRKKDVPAFIALMQNNWYMSEDDKYDAFEPIMGLIESQDKRLDQIADNFSIEDKTILEELASKQQIILLQNLPVKLFQHQINSYADNLMRCSVPIFNKVNWTQALDMLDNAKSLPIEKETMDRVVDKENEMRGIMANAGKKSNSKDHSNIIFRIGFFLLFIVAKVICNNNSHSYTPTNFSDFTYNGQSINSKQQLEDLIEEQKNVREQSEFLDKITKSIVANSFLSGKNNIPYNLKKEEDVFNKYWFKKPSKILLEKDDSLNIKDDTGSFSGFEKLIINNRSTLDAIVIIVKKDAVMSSVVKPASSTEMSMNNGTNKIYIYAGKIFSLSDSIVVKKDAFDSTLVSGWFKKYNTENNKYLIKPIVFNVDAATVIEKKPYPIIRLKSDAFGKLETGISSGGFATYIE